MNFFRLLLSDQAIYNGNKKKVFTIRKVIPLMLSTIMFFSLSACKGIKTPQADNEPSTVIPSENLVATPASAQAKSVEPTTMNIPETIYLWNEGNMPSTTEYTVNNSGYFAPPDFRPNIVYVSAKQGVEVKGAVLICAGGAFQVRSENDGIPVAEQLSELGYQSFIVNYRLRPYTMQEGALDLARAVRYVRSHAEELNMDENNIAVIGFSAGGILCGELLLNFDGLIDGSAIDPSYVPDELDKVSADASAVSMIYSFYGRLSVASTDVEKFKESDLPPTYFLYGSEEIFRSQIEACAEAVQEAGVPVESQVLEGLQHGFGARGDWFAGFDTWLTKVFGI